MATAFLYSLYGLNLRSNVALPGLWPSDHIGKVDVEVTLGKLHQDIDVSHEPWFSSAYLDENGKPYLIVWKSSDGAAFHFLYGDDTQFVVDRDGRRASAIWPESLNLENTTVYLVGQIAAFILRLRGTVCLHASSILVDGRALAIAGDTGSGKSTTAASFVRLGHSVLSEDVTPLIDNGVEFLVQPGYPRINLWTEPAESLSGFANGLPKIAPTWNKRYLDLQECGDRFHRKPAPLGGIYVLSPRSESAPSLTRLARSDALISLLSNAHGRYLLEKPMRVREFELLSKVSDRIPVRSVVAHTDLSRIDKLCAAIVDDFRNSSFTKTGAELV